MRLPRQTILGCFALALAGCLSTPVVTPIRYYTVRPEISVAPAESSGTTLGIRPLASARPYKVEIAYTAEPNRLAYFPRAEWAETPAAVLDRALLQGIQQLGRFRDAGNAAVMARPDYMLTGELVRFEADFTGEAPEAVVEVHLVVREGGGVANTWEGQLLASVPLDGANPAPPVSDTALARLAQAMSEAVAAIVADACEGLRQAPIAPR